MRPASFAALIAIALIGIPFARAARPSDPAVVIEPSRITVSGVTPGGDVLFVGAGLEPKKYYAIPHRWSRVLADTDAKGTVSYDLEGPVTWNALWIVTDLTTGRYVVASTPGFPVERSHLASRHFQRDTHGQVSQFAYERSVADVLYIASGGAWTLLARDGDSSDGDSKDDGITTIDLPKLRPAAPGKPIPSAFAPGATLLIIDSSRLDLLELKVDASTISGAR
jgi:hypothetical protein